MKVASRPGRTVGEVYGDTMAAMKATQHRGPDLFASDRQPGTRPRRQHRLPRRPRGDRTPPPKRLRKGSYISIELNTLTPVPEWDGQKVFIMMEDDAYLTDEGWNFFRPRQEQFYLVR